MCIFMYILGKYCNYQHNEWEIPYKNVQDKKDSLNFSVRLQTWCGYEQGTVTDRARSGVVRP